MSDLPEPPPLTLKERIKALQDAANSSQSGPSATALTSSSSSSTAATAGVSTSHRKQDRLEVNPDSSRPRAISSTLQDQNACAQPSRSGRASSVTSEPPSPRLPVSSIVALYGNSTPPRTTTSTTEGANPLASNSLSSIYPPLSPTGSHHTPSSSRPSTPLAPQPPSEESPSLELFAKSIRRRAGSTASSAAASSGSRVSDGVADSSASIPTMGSRGEATGASLATSRDRSSSNSSTQTRSGEGGLPELRRLAIPSVPPRPPATRPTTLSIRATSTDPLQSHSPPTTSLMEFSPTVEAAPRLAVHPASSASSSGSKQVPSLPPRLPPRRSTIDSVASTSSTTSSSSTTTSSRSAPAPALPPRPRATMPSPASPSSSFSSRPSATARTQSPAPYVPSRSSRTLSSSPVSEKRVQKGRAIDPRARSRYEAVFEHLVEQYPTPQRTSGGRRQQPAWIKSGDAMGDPATAATAERIDGAVVRAIWIKSRLGVRTLKELWSKLDTSSSGSLSKDEFVQGMWWIDEILRSKQSR